MKFRKKPIVIEAERWFQNGCHSLDNSSEAYAHNDFPQDPPHDQHEGALVRYYRRPDVDGESICPACREDGTPGQRMMEHGWIDTLEGGHRVCPGDWIIRGIKGEFYPCKHDIFKETYEPVEAGEEVPVGQEAS